MKQLNTEKLALRSNTKLLLISKNAILTNEPFRNVSKLVSVKVLNLAAYFLSV